MTRRLYHESDALAFDASVIGHDGDDTRVVLDRTAFYPTSGGQPHDTGTLGGASVIDVIDADDRIIHVLDAPLPLGLVHGEVDVARRRDHTVQHTAQHLVSAIAADRLGWSTESVHFGATHSTIEFDAAAASDAQLRQLEQWSNDAIAAALPVSTGVEDAATATALRKPTDRTGLIRVVTIDGHDRSACGGTHVPNTAALGMVFIAGVESVRGHVRLAFLAGDRVLARLKRRDAALAALAEATGAGVEEVEQVVPARLDAMHKLERRLHAAERELAGHRLRELVATTTPPADGIRRLLLDTDKYPLPELRLMAQAVASESRLLLVGSTDQPATVIVAASSDSEIDAGSRLKQVLGAVGGRGGGSTTLAQGTVPDRELLHAAVQELAQ